MRALATLAGVLLFSLGLAGLITLGAGPRRGLQLELTRLAAGLGLVPAHPQPSAAPLTPDEAAHALPVAVEGVAGARDETPAPAPVRLSVPRIRLDAEIVPAQLIRVGSGVTWEVPAFRAGHAQGTAGAGGIGNMVLLGHVTSLNAGNVFQDLDKLGPGDEIVVQGASGELLTYRVDETRRVERTDASIVTPDDRPRLTLLTCTGTWLPQLADYSHRLAVRALLVPPA
ncbi:MAG TPA: class F sortase [Chloroflexota bacterium]|nr:class F sortase [Chloroflexota bacterium]